MYLQICTYPRRAIYACSLLSLVPPLPTISLVSSCSRTLLPSGNLPSPSPRPRTNNQVDVKQRTSLSLSPFLCSSHLRFCPCVYVNHYVAAVCAICTTSDIFAWQYYFWHTWIGYPFSPLILTGRMRFRYHNFNALVSSSSYFVVFLEFYLGALPKRREFWYFFIRHLHLHYTNLSWIHIFTNDVSVQFLQWLNFEQINNYSTLYGNDLNLRINKHINVPACTCVNHCSLIY